MSRWLLGLASMSRSLRPPGRKQANALDRPLGIYRRNRSFRVEQRTLLEVGESKQEKCAIRARALNPTGVAPRRGT